MTDKSTGRYQLDGMPPFSVGAGALTNAGTIVRDVIGDDVAVMIIADPGLARFGYVEQLQRSLVDSGLTPIVFDGFSADPPFAEADLAAGLARMSRARTVIGLGGGSAMDLAKAVAVGAAGEGSVARFALGAEDLPSNTLPMVAIPTTSGTGSETTRTAVLSDDAGAKQWIWGQVLKPIHAILDPELTVDLPRALTAATGLDALIHAIEAATNRNANQGNTAIALSAIRLVAMFLPSAIDDPSDLEARGAMQLAAANAGVAIDNTGTAIAHAMGHALASLAKVHHGQAVASAMAATLPWNVADDDGRFARVADAMGGPHRGAAVPDLFAKLADRVGHSFELPVELSISPQRLAAQVRRPENVPMLAANWRAAGDAELSDFARKMLSST